jgi:hypothetical protein
MLERIRSATSAITITLVRVKGANANAVAKWVTRLRTAVVNFRHDSIKRANLVLPRAAMSAEKRVTLRRIAQQAGQQ